MNIKEHVAMLGTVEYIPYDNNQIRGMVHWDGIFRAHSGMFKFRVINSNSRDGVLERILWTIKQELYFEIDSIERKNREDRL